jgi:hypothetical protein
MNNMTEEFIPYQQALALKELGFDQPCFGSFDEEGKLWHYVSNTGQDTIRLGNIIAPVYQQAFRWFREKFNLYHEIKRQRGVNDSSNVFYVPITCDGGKKENTHTPQSTYEQSELVCLIKLIQILNQKL